MGIFLLLCVVFLFVLGLIVSRAVGPLFASGKVEQPSAAQIQETTDSLENIRQTLLLLSQDSNELRRAMGLPQRFYSSLDPFSGETQNLNENDLVFFRAIDLLKIQRSLKQHSATFAAIKSGIREQASARGLEIQESEVFSIKIKKGSDTYFTVIYRPEKEGKLLIRTFLDAYHESDVFDVESIRFFNANVEELDRHFQSTKLELANIEDSLNKRAIRHVLMQNGLNIAGPLDTEDQYVYTITRGAESLADFGIHKKSNLLSLNARTISEFGEFEKQLMDLIEKLGGQDYKQSKIIEIQSNMNHVFESTAFIEQMRANGMRTAERNRESEIYIHYDVVDETDRRIGSFAIQKESGEIFLLDREDLPICTLQSLLSATEDEKKN